MGEIPVLSSTESNNLDVSVGSRASSSSNMGGAQRIAVSDHMISGFSGESDSFIVDLESLSHGGVDKDVNAESRIKLQRSLNRKGPHQGGSGGDNSLLASSSSSSSSPTVEQAMATSTPEKLVSSPFPPPMVISLGPTDHHINGHQPHNHNHQHQITIIKTGHVTTTAAPEIRWGRRYNSFKRSPPPSWFFDPKRVLFFFATLSSIGTILLIYFTLSMSKTDDGDGRLDWQR